MSIDSDNTFGSLSSAPDGRIIECIYNYVFAILTDLKGTSTENENTLTNRLCKDLGAKRPAEYPFFFQHQNQESDNENTSTDFAVFETFPYSTPNSPEPPSLIKFEAKRLNNTLPSNREREYVIGGYKNGRRENSGGIERFKNGRHGQDVVNAGIIGYVQTDSFTHWLKKVNGWVEDEIKKPTDSNLVWDKNDLLVLVEGDARSFYCRSKSKRLSEDFISFRHFWVSFN